MANVIDTTTQFTADKIQAKKNKALADKADGTNPKSQLDKDAFMKLLLTELQYQDPTSPMDTEKMLTQTSQLATLEMQENTNSAMKELVSQLKTNSSMYALSALGKMASLGTDKVVLDEGDRAIDIPVYFEDDVSDGRVEILDSSASNANILRSIPFSNLKQGVNKISWDTLGTNGAALQPGAYSVRIKYTNTDGQFKSAKYGEYPVESVKFIGGKANVKIAGEYQPVDKVAEFYEARRQNSPKTEPKAEAPKPEISPKPQPENESGMSEADEKEAARIAESILRSPEISADDLASAERLLERYGRQP